MEPLLIRALLLGVLVLLALVAALIAGIAARIDGASWSRVLGAGACCFAGSLTLGVLVFTAFGGLAA